MSYTWKARPGKIPVLGEESAGMGGAGETPVLVGHRTVGERLFKGMRHSGLK